MLILSVAAAVFATAWFSLLLAGTFRSLSSTLARPTMGRALPGCSVVIPCYIPNEKNLIRKTIDAYTRQESVANVVVVYNGVDETGVFGDVELLKNSKLSVLECRDSHSRAENLNHALRAGTLESFTLISDADNVPCSDSTIQRLCAALDRAPLSTMGVQGIVYQRFESLVSAVSNAMVFMFSAMIGPGFELVVGTTLFTGSGCLFRTEVLRRYEFRDRYLDDLDFLFRAMADGNNMQPSVSCQFNECPVVGWRALARQKYRYFMGLVQTLVEESKSTCTKRPRAAIFIVYNVGSYLLCLLQLVAGVLRIDDYVKRSGAHDDAAELAAAFVVSNACLAAVIVGVGVASALIVYRTKDDYMRKQALGLAVGSILVVLFSGAFVVLVPYILYCSFCRPKKSVQTVTIRRTEDVA